MIAGVLFAVQFSRNIPGDKYSVTFSEATAEIDDNVTGVAGCDSYDAATTAADEWLAEQGGEWVQAEHMVFARGPEWLPVVNIFRESTDELEYQATKWAKGSLQDLVEIDLKHNSPNDYVAYISHYASRWFPGGFPPYTTETLKNFRVQMIKVLTLAVSAVRWVDATLQHRQEQAAPKKPARPSNLS